MNARRLSSSTLIACVIVPGFLAACGSEPRTEEPGDAGVVSDADGSGGTPDVIGTDTTGADVPSEDVGPFEPACEEEDRYAPNQDATTALGVPADGFEDDELWHCEGADDFYRVRVPAGRRMVVELTPVDAPDALLLVVEGVNGETLDGVFQRTGETAQVARYESDADAEVIVRVSGRNAGAYALAIAVDCIDDAACGEGFVCSLADGRCIEAFEPECGDDVLELNNSISEAYAVDTSESFARSTLSVCEDDDDYFALTFDEATTVSGLVAFEEGNNLNVLLFGADGRRFDGAEAEDANPETFTFARVPAGTWYLVVDDAVTGLGLDTRYEIELNFTAAGCASNDDCASVTGRQVCEDGGCVSYVPEEPNPGGGDCDDSTDCVEGLGCYNFDGSFDANFCTQNCVSDEECSSLPDGYCLAFGRSGICFSTCETAADCPNSTTCNGETGRCEAQRCGLDEDCDGSAVCLRNDDNVGLCSRPVVGSCEESDEYEPNNTDSAAVNIDDLRGRIRDATICDNDDDWYSLTIEDDGAELTVEVETDTGADIDVYVYDSAGRAVGAGTSPDGNPEVALAERLAAGTYLIRVDQFAREEFGNVLTTYEMTWSLASSVPCTEEANTCLSNQPIRFICDEERNGSCVFLEGDGTIEPGGFCDSSNDCTDASEFCWTFTGAEAGENVCTSRCASESDCEDIPGTTCRTFGRGFAACVP